MLFIGEEEEKEKKKKMIKRRFYKIEHAGGNDDASDSSSDSEVEAEADAEEEASEEASENDVKVHNESSSTSSGYASEDSSANEVGIDSSGLLLNEEDAETGNDIQNLTDRQLSGSHSAKISEESDIIAEKDSLPADVAGHILKCKSVFRCRLCPRIVCLTEESLRAHLKSKRHARSEKLLNDGRLKVMLNSDGEEEQQETPAEMHARIVALAQPNQKMKNKGRQRQRKRLRRKKVGDDSDTGKARQGKQSPAKKRRKNEN